MVASITRIQSPLNFLLKEVVVYYNYETLNVVLGHFSFHKFRNDESILSMGIATQGSQMVNAYYDTVRTFPILFCKRIIGVLENNYFYDNLYLKSKLFYSNVHF
jgi:hypothetical protein